MGVEMRLARQSTMPFDLTPFAAQAGPSDTWLMAYRVFNPFFLHDTGKVNSLVADDLPSSTVPVGT